VKEFQSTGSYLPDVIEIQVPVLGREVVNSGEGQSAGVYLRSSGSEWDLVIEPGGYSQLACGLVQQMGRILRNIAEAPGTLVSRIRLQTEEEIESIRQQLSGPQRPYSDLTISQLFEQTARRCANQVALIDATARTTYGELNDRANRLANLLKRKGVRTEELVGLCMDASIDAIIAILAILKAGGTYVPLDPQHPRARLAEIVQDTGIRLILVGKRSGQRVGGIGPDLFDVDLESNGIDAEDSQDLPCSCTPDSAAYVLYTSGSTGRPNGVVGINRSITNGLHEIQFNPSRPDEVSCLNSPLSVGISLLLLFLPILSGIPLVLLSEEQSRDPIRLADAVAEHKITTIGVATPMLRLLLNAGQRVASRLRTLRSVMVGGAPLTPDMVQRFEEMLPRTTLENGYGSTEAGSIVARGIVSSGNISIGRPISNTRVYILDKYGNPVPRGAIGEIYVGAAHLARGYWERPDVTASRFLVHASSMGEERVYRTGDLGKITPNGIDFLGRIDDQVKIRGYRVHLSEIEAVLSGCDGIRSVVVAARILGDEQRLVAYLEGSVESGPPETLLRDYARQHLPSHMVPTAFVWLTHLPLTAGGKIDRNTLPIPPLTEGMAGGLSLRDTHDEVTAFLLDTWRTVLMMDRIGINDHFLDLGGDSLFAVNVTSRVWEKYGSEITLEDFFDHPTIAQLAEVVRARALDGTEDEAGAHASA